ncbi:MAG TPA: TetR/AcrR family transcriptional regulator [Acidimicrobiales bacterium]|jgi:AcrR family transcriptional regulator
MGVRGEPEPSTVLGALTEGPARLSAEDVAASQRRRMIAAMIAAVAEKGYVHVAVADVVKGARVSRATFYEQFTDKADCFLAAFHACVDDFVGVLRARDPSARAPRERLYALLENYLGALAAFPEGARVCLVEIYAAGPEAALHRQQIQLDFVRLVRDLHTALADAGEPVRPLGGFAFEALVGAISSLATNYVAAGRTAELPELATPLTGFALTHFGLEP